MMRFYSETLELTPAVFGLLGSVIHEHLGLYYDDGKREILADKLSPLVLEAGFDSFLDFYYLLKYDSDADAHWDRVMDVLSVQETYFWREMDQVQALVDHILPQYAKQYPEKPLSIWSAACASGEEPLTIAMALKERGLLDRHPIDIHGSDASLRALDKARAGCYGERAFRNLTSDLKNRYFTEKSGKDCIVAQLHDNVRFHKANLLRPEEIAPLAKSPFIFCRNVFIYFSEKSIKKTVDFFHAKMPSPSYLFVGASESLLKLGTPFELEEIGGAFVYVKK